ncbi:MAG: aminotransferase class I/II-fold pyridoxal phosphate-dependent enzyme [Oscillospiraceae bacterium]|nr:aminotransferase class I/II-fold pyridoxal phosphate-dependent enzyme [Oscillospiraceae bacterium]
MDIKFAERMDGFQPGIFNMLDDRKNDRLAQGKPVYNLSIGTPDFLPEPHIVEALAWAASNPNSYRYSLGETAELREAVRSWYGWRYGVKLAADELMVVYGSQEGLTHIGWTLCNPGDVVLVPDPGYPIFELGPHLCGAQCVHYPLRAENGYLPDLEHFDKELAEKARFMVVSYPANPLGVTVPDEFYQQLISFAKTHNIIVIHDNAYSDITFDGREGKSFLAFEGAKEVGVELNSLSKTYNLTGARISFVVGNREVVGAFKRLRSQIDYGIFLPVQAAAVAALNGPQDSIARNRAEYQARRDALCGGLRSIGWDVPDSQGSMFVWAPVPESFDNSTDFCFELLECTGLLCTPGSAFGPLGEGHVRFALVQPVPVMNKIVSAVKSSGIIGGGL